MTVTHRLICDQCGEKLVYEDTPEKEGWLEVWLNDEISRDFCGQECLVEYYSGDNEEDE